MNNRGAALIITYTIIVILASLGAILMQQSISEYLQVKRFVSSTRAFWVAEAGAHRGFWELNYGTGVGTYQGTETGVGDYDVTLTQVDTEHVTITATGSVPSRTSTQKITRRVTLTTHQVYIPIFRYAAFGKQSVSLVNSSTTNSYDSDLGDYNVAGNIGSNGDVGTNGNTAGAISLSNSSVINGDANTGPTGTVTKANSSNVTGSTSHTANEAYPQVAVPVALQNLTSLGAKSLTNSATDTLGAGDYKYTSLSLSNSAVLTITGNVRIYLTSTSSAFSIANSSQFKISAGASVTVYTQGKASVGNSGQINNLTKKPADFILYSSYTGSNGVDIANSSDFYGSIYAPGTSVQFSNSAHIYGSAIGKTVSLPNSVKIHYDEALGRLMAASVPSGDYSITSWSES